MCRVGLGIIEQPNQIVGRDKTTAESKHDVAFGDDAQRIEALPLDCRVPDDGEGMNP
jgi:hypothetical protein